MTHDDVATAQARLEAIRHAYLAKYGLMSENVIAKSTPFVHTADGPLFVPWPWYACGKAIIIRREASALVVTDGLSDPWSPELHESPPAWTFGFEAAIEVPVETMGDASDAAIADSWIPLVLWALTDWVVGERFHVKELLNAHGCLTLAIPPVEGLEHLVASNGAIGLLAGVPFLESRMNFSMFIAEDAEFGRSEHTRDWFVWLLPMKILTPDEYEWAMGVKDGRRAALLAQAFLRRGDRHLSWPARRSILREPGFLGTLS